MSVPFPPAPRGTIIAPRLVRVGGDLVSTLGGPTQRITRLGSRYAVDVELPMLDALCAGAWLAVPLHAEATGDTVIFTMPQPIDIAQIGLPTGTGVAGSNQVTVANASNARSGMWFSFAAGGRNYLHLVTSILAVDKIAVSPMLRAPMNATPMDFAAPKLEGFTAPDPAWRVEWSRFIGHSFSITESA